MSLATSSQIMIHDINFNKITFIDRSKMLAKHVFCDLSYATTMSNMIKKTNKMSLITSCQPYDLCNYQKWLRKQLQSHKPNHFISQSFV
jgi:hypothetical protein